jgi:hypothetical protein
MSTFHPNKRTSPWLAVWLMLLGAGIFALFIILVLRATSSKVAGDDKRAQERAKISQELRTKGDVELTSAAWVNKEKQVVRLPIDVAMSLTVSELKNKKMRAGSVAESIPSTIVPPQPK